MKYSIKKSFATIVKQEPVPGSLDKKWGRRCQLLLSQKMASASAFFCLRHSCNPNMLSFMSTLRSLSIQNSKHFFLLQYEQLSVSSIWRKAPWPCPLNFISPNVSSLKKYSWRKRSGTYCTGCNVMEPWRGVAVLRRRAAQTRLD
jgi:hypothetical protein